MSEISPRTNENHRVVVLDCDGRDFGDARAISNVSLDVNGGEIVALHGPNGVGKTSALDAVLGLATPSTGAGLRSDTKRRFVSVVNIQPLSCDASGVTQ